MRFFCKFVTFAGFPSSRRRDDVSGQKTGIKEQAYIISIHIFFCFNTNCKTYYIIYYNNIWKNEKEDDGDEKFCQANNEKDNMENKSKKQIHDGFFFHIILFSFL